MSVEWIYKVCACVIANNKRFAQCKRTCEMKTKCVDVRTRQSTRNGGRTSEQVSEHVLGTPFAQSFLPQQASLTALKRAGTVSVGHVVAWPNKLRR